jgi:hypothetical protein
MLYWRDREFYSRFRMTKETVTYVTDLIREDIDHDTIMNNALTPEMQVMSTLFILGGGTRQVGGGDMLQVHRTTASRAFHKVTAALASKRNDFIYMPTPDEVPVVRRGFFNLAQFPGVIGALDCTHVRIRSPGGNNAEVYRNRKGQFSINVQLIADADLMIRNIVARWPGKSI